MEPRAQVDRERQPRQDLSLRAELVLPIPSEQLQVPYLKVMFDREFNLYLNGYRVKTARRNSLGKYGGFWLPLSARASLQSGSISSLPAASNPTGRVVWTSGSSIGKSIFRKE